MIIAHDLGTSGDKATLHDDRGRLIASVTVSYSTDYGANGSAEQDPEAWYVAVADATRSLLDRTSTGRAHVAGLVISGQMSAAVLLDSAHRPVRPAMIWADTRSRPQAQLLESTVGSQRMYELTGHRINPMYTLEKVMYVRDAEPTVFARVAHVCQAKDYVAYRLTGRLATDRTDASGTNAFDQAASQWSGELLNAAGLDIELFPEVCESTAILGGLTRLAAEDLGLTAGTSVVMGGGDGPMATVGAGIVSPADGAYASLGTSSWIGLASAAPLHDPAMRSMTFDSPVPGQFTPIATMQAGGASLEWFREVLLGVTPGLSAAEAVELAEGVSASSEGLFFLPHIMGERSPHWNPLATGAFVGLSRTHAVQHMVSAVLEGVAFNLYACIEAFREGGATISSVDAIGGGAASDIWLQVMANTWGVPVRRRTVVEEANSLGAAVTAAVALGLVDSFDSARDLSSTTKQLDPDPARHEAYVDQYEVFQQAYAALEPWFESRAESLI